MSIGCRREQCFLGNDLVQEDLLARIACSADTELMTAGCGLRSDDTRSVVKGRVAGCFSLLSILAACMAYCAGKRSERFDARGHSASWRWSAVASAGSVALQLVTISVFCSSALFKDLGKNFACHFKFAHPLNSNYLTCHALGPAFGLAVGGCITGVMATLLFYFAYKKPGYISAFSGRYSLYHVYSAGSRPLDYSSQEVVNGYVSLNGPSPESFDSDAEDTLVEPLPHVSLQQMIKVYYVPVMAFANIALFVWSNCSTGATVEPNIVIRFPKDLRWIVHDILPHQIGKDGVLAFKDDVFNFTLITSLKHFWKGGAYGLAVLIGVFSGMWPYIKLFTMVILWFVPATEKMRGKLLHWLDVLGKWSLVDAYVLCLMAVAFGFNTDRTILGIEIHVDISVRPGWGVYSFVIATMCSLLLSHHLTFLHRQCMDGRKETASLKRTMKRPPLESLSYRAYAPFPNRRRFGCTWIGRRLLWVILFSTFVITLTGTLLHTFEFRFSGLVDLILPVEKRNTGYSLVTNGILLPQAAKNGGFLSGGNWAWFITIMYFTFAMAVPLLTLIALAILWSFPFTLRTTKKVFHICQFLQAWAALDVFLISIIAACLEIGGLSSSVIGDAFGGIQSTVCTLLEKLPPEILDAILHEVGLPSIDDELEDCALFRVDAVLLEGCWMLLFSVCMWGVMTHVIMEFADASIEERTIIATVLCSYYDDSSSANEDSEAVDPYLLLRVRSPDETPSDDVLSPVPRLQGFGNSANEREAIQSIYVKEIIKAQENGASRFMGTYFGDCMYGPFPRSWWTKLCKVRILKRVPWEELSYNVHARLLINLINFEDD